MLYYIENVHGGDIYQSPVKLDFSVNLNPLGTPQRVIDAMKDAVTHASVYPDPYCRGLVEAISRTHQIPASYILCGNGAAELIYTYCAALHPHSAVMPAPTFSEYETALKMLFTVPAGNSMIDPSCNSVLNSPGNLVLNPSGNSALDLPGTFAEAGYAGAYRTESYASVHQSDDRIDEPCGSGACRSESSASGISPVKISYYYLQEKNGFQLEDGFLTVIRDQRPDVIFLCNPNNPDGRTIPAALLKEILKLCRKQSIRLLLDECFLDLSDHGTSMIEYLGNYPELFLLRAFTKNYALAGVRLGYGLCSDPQLLHRMSSLVQPWNVSVVAQAAGIAALEETGYLDRARALIRMEKEWLLRQLEQLGYRVFPSEANYLLFQGPTGLDLMLRRQGIAIRDCSNYKGLDTGWYRIAVRNHEDNQQLIRSLEKISK